MQYRKSNEETLNNLYQNAHVALQSISDLIPETDDAMMRAELKEQYEGYEKIIGEISGFMKDNDITPKDIGPMKKMMLKASVKMNAAKNDNRSHIAEMMIKGGTMGITDATKLLREYENTSCSEDVLSLARRVIKYEEETVERLKKFL